MSKKLILFLMVLLFGSTSFLRADEYEAQIGDGTSTTGYFPFYTLYNYSIGENLFLASELEEAGVGTGEMTSLSWYATNAPGYEQQGISIWMANVTDTELTTTSHVVTGMTLVYTGSMTPAIGWNEFVFNGDSFAWDGTSNILIFCQRNNGTWNSTVFWQSTTANFNAASYKYQDSGAFDVTVANTMSTSTGRTNIIFKGQNGGTPTPTPTPGQGLTLSPNAPFELGNRPMNAWMEPYVVTIYNGDAETMVQTSITNTSGVEPFALDPAIDATLATGESVEFEIQINNDVEEGEYNEEISLFSVVQGRTIEQLPVNAYIYTPDTYDVVETAQALTLVPANENTYEFEANPETVYGNYILEGMTELAAYDAVYVLNLAKDSRVTAIADGDIYVYNMVEDFHPTAEVEPLLTSLDDKVLLAGSYYIIVTSDTDAQIYGEVIEIPAPLALTALTPANGAINVPTTTALTWEGGENATEYRVLFGTSATNLPVAMDWTMVDENYGTYALEDLSANTQYFWKVEVRNSNGQQATQRWGFTTVLTQPNTLTATEAEIFTDESTLIKWKFSGAGGFTGEITVADGTESNYYVPVYGLWVDDYTRSEMIYPAEMLEEMEGGEITTLTFYLSTSASAAWAPAQFNVYMMEVEGTTLSSYYTSANASIVYTGELDATGETMVINLDTPYTYDGGNLLIGIEETVEGTYKSAYFYGVTATGASASGYSSSSLSAVTFNQRDFLPKATFTCGGKGNDNRTFQSFNLYVDGVMVNEDPIYEKQYLLEDLEYAMPEGHAVTVTAVYDEGESLPSTPVTVYVSGYGAISGQVTSLATTQAASAPVAGATVTFTGKDEFNNNVEFTGTTDDNGAYIINGVKVGTYTGVATLEGNEPAYTEANPVAVVYDTTTEEIDFIMHEEYKPVTSVLAEEVDPTMSRVKWSLNYAISGGGSGGSASTFTEGFESGMPEGWTVVDANNDGYTWCLTSAIPTTWTYYASLTLDWYRTGTNAICSGSFINGAGALNPDEYLVMGQQNIANGSTLSFWAAATDASYPADHFGVAVSDDATTWTMVQEWTLTGKKGANGGRESRDGNGAKLGTWYNYTVDLSAYAGQKYIAIRHFNCYDQYIMCVDDIELAAASKDRSFDHYAVYRKAILKENEIVPADSVVLSETVTDTLYADFTWNNMEPGLYQYGVQAVYPTPIEAKGGNRDEIVIGDPTSTTTNSYLPTYSLYEYSLTEQIYTADEIGMAGTINTLTMWLKNNSSYARNINVYMKEVDVVTFADGNAWVSMEDSDMVASFTLANGISSPVETAIALNTPFNYSGNGNLVICFQDVTGSWSSGAASVVMTGNGNQAIYAYRDGTVYNPTTPGVTGYVTTNKSVIMLDITPGGGGGNDNPVTPITWSNILPKDMQTVLTVNVTSPADIMDGAIVELVNQFEIGTDFAAVVDSLGTPIVFDDFRKGEYVLFCEMPGFVTGYEEGIPVSIWGEETITINCQEIFSPVDGVSVAVTGFASWTDMIGGDRYPERYMLKLDGVYYTETDNNYIQIDEDLLTIGETYTFEVAVVYSMGLSSYVGTSFVYGGCEGVETQVDTLYVDEEASTGMNVALVWNEGVAPGPTPPTPPTPPTGETYDFESGMQGWTTIDADGDGYTWGLGSSLMGTGYGHNGSSDLVLSQSYDNNYGVLYPDNYLVSPAKAAYTSISFYACAQDSGYPQEHFGVAVSTTTATASAFTMVQEWTMTAKGSGVMATGRDGQTRAQGAWYEKTVDLSAYAGQEIWIAIRHFNCSDMFYLDVDDITLGGSKNFASAESCGTAIPTAPVRAMWDLVYSFSGTSAGQQAVATDGEYIYTASWQSTPTGGYTFYKYDLQGNFVEGFNIAGATAIRDITYDGQYFYGTSGATQIFCMDFTNKTLVSTINCSGLTSRHISYDPVRDGFWSGNWETLALYSRTGALVQSGPAPTSAYGSAYYKDSDNVEHLYLFCQPNSDAKVYDYDIANNTISSSPVFDFASTPGYNAGISGGCFIGNYEGKACFFGNIQQDPNLIGIYELGAAQGGGGGGGGTVEGLTPNKFNIAVDDLDNVVAATSDMSYMLEAADYEMHTYYVFYVDAQYGISCPEAIDYQCEPEAIEENAIVNAIYPNPTSGDLHINAEAMTHITIVNAMGQVVYTMDVNADETVIDMAKFEAGVYMVSVITENGTTVKRVTVVK